MNNTISQTKLDNEFQDKAALAGDLREHSFDPQNSLGSFSNGKWYKIYWLTCREFLIQNKVNNLIKYLFSFFLFYTLSIILINNHDEIKKFGIIFSVIYLPISLIGFSGFILKPDLINGSLEQCLICFSAFEILLAKFLNLAFCSIVSSAITMPLIYIIFDTQIEFLKILSIVIFLISLLACSLVVLISTVECYFMSNTNFLSISIMPLMIPTIILSGMIIEDFNNIGLLYIIIGINLVVIPISLLLSHYLLKNIYNI